MGRLLAIDGGRSRCRVAVFGPGGVRESSAEGRGLPTGEGLPALAQAVGEAVALAEVNPGTVAGAGAGLAGLLGTPDQAPELARRLSELLGVKHVVLTGDAVAAYAGALGPVPGVVVVAGTGAVALGLTAPRTSRERTAPPHRELAEGTSEVHLGNARQAWARVDGWGPLLGDAGSGYWIGRRGLEEGLRAHDGRGGSATLARLAETHVGPLDSLPGRIAGAARPTAVIAGFAPWVADAARRGDTAAGAIWAGAAGELAATAAACVHGLFPPDLPVPVSWSGGLFAAADLLLEPFLERLAELAPDAVATPPAGDGLDGVFALTTNAAELFRPLVYAPGVATPFLPRAGATDPALT